METQLPRPQKGGRAPNFRPMSIVAKRSPISATAEHVSDRPMLVERLRCGYERRRFGVRVSMSERANVSLTFPATRCVTSLVNSSPPRVNTVRLLVLLLVTVSLCLSVCLSVSLSLSVCLCVFLYVSHALQVGPHVPDTARARRPHTKHTQ